MAFRCNTVFDKIFLFIILLDYALLMATSIIYLKNFDSEITKTHSTSENLGVYLIPKIYVNLAVYSSIPTIILFLLSIVWLIFKCLH